MGVLRFKNSDFFFTLQIYKTYGKGTKVGDGVGVGVLVGVGDILLNSTQ